MKNTGSFFDVTIGSYEGAEIWELVETYIFSPLSKFINKNNCGLYRDDGLILLKNTTDKKWIKSEIYL